ncbi:MAG: hypothetical protein CL610_17610 [Anaerolineaceae bacterium]|nr:hypothetical protein [Anaerolineaceae bacterium]
MAKLIVIITPLLDEAHQIAEAWQQVGAPGVTFIESYGIRRIQEASQSIEVLPGMMSMMEMLRDRDETSVTLLSLVKKPELVQTLIDTAQDIVGSFEREDNGILFVIDVETAIGLRPIED